MKIITTQYGLKNKSFEIVVSGCRGKNGVHCKGCHNPESWDFNNGVEFKSQLYKISTKLERFKKMIDWVWIYGGEPLDQDHNELIELIDFVAGHEVPIMLFTRFDISEIPKNILDRLDYVKCGEYIEELKGKNIQYGVELATLNQKIYKLREGDGRD